MVISEILKTVEGFLQPAPTPDGMTSREIVKQAIEFNSPPRIPYSFVEPRESDFFEAALLWFLLPEDRRKELGIFKPKREVGEI
jgi:hypothetical protein